jgi:hypothetical protein
MHSFTLPFKKEIWNKSNMNAVPTHATTSLFLRLKIKLKGRYFDTIEVLEAESQAARLQDAFKIGRRAWNAE